MEVFSEELRQRLIDVSKGRFFDRIELLDLYLWVKNFNPKEYDLAISVLEHIDFYREFDFISLFESAISNLSISSQNPVFHFLSVGKPGKSGDLALYQLQKIYSSKKKKPNIYYYADEVFNQKLDVDDYIVFVDDYIGSGNSFYDYINGMPSKDNLLNYPRLCLISGIIMDDGLRFLKRNYKQIIISYGDIKYKAFKKGISPFGGYIKMKRIRDLCYKYGMKLFPNGPLGYKNVQSLVIMEHASPNNSLPILWSNKKNWYPLFPRSYSINVERMTQNRQDTNRWISLIRKNIGVPNGVNIASLYSNHHSIIINILILLINNKSEYVIANTLGLTHNDMQFFKQLGISYKYWDNNWIVPEFIRQQYIEDNSYFLRKRRQDEDLILEKQDDKNQIYVPETFRQLK